MRAWYLLLVLCAVAVGMAAISGLEATASAGPRIAVDPAAADLWLCDTIDPTCDDKASGHGAVNLNVELTGAVADQIGGVEFEVRFDPKLLAVEVTPGALLQRPQVSCVTVPSYGSVRFGCFTLGKPVDASRGPGTLAVLHARPTEDAASILALKELDALATALLVQSCGLSDLQGDAMKVAACDDATITIRPLLVEEPPPVNLWLCAVPTAPGCDDKEAGIEQVNLSLALTSAIPNPAQQLGAFEFEVRYDPALLDIAVERGSLFDRPEVNCLIVGGGGLIQFRCATLGKPADAPRGPGTLAVVHVRGTEQARAALIADPSDSIRSPLVLQGCQLSDLQGHSIDVGETNLCDNATVVMRLLAGDTDGDSCTDASEVQTAAGSELSGGRRDPLNPYDFFDVPLPAGPPGTGSKNGAINIFDVLGVLAKYGTHDNGTPNDFSDDPPNAGGQTYNPDFDRTLVGPNAWNSGPPDGVINIFDVLRVLAQFGHSCLGA